MERINSKNAPHAIGPYSQGVKVGEFLFISGQLPVDGQTNQLLNGDIQLLTRKVIENIEAILKEAGAALSDVVQTSVFLTDLKEFKAMNEEYAKHFKGPVYPARQTIQVAALPLGAAIEISCIANVDLSKKSE